MARRDRRSDLKTLPYTIIIDGDLLLFARRYDESITQYRKVLEIEANNPYIYISLGLCYFKKNLDDEAVAEFLKAASVSGKKPDEVEALKSAFERSGMKGFWQEMIKQNKRSKEGYVSSYNMAAFYAAAGEKEQALDWLEKAYREHSSGMTALKVDPLFDNIRLEPRFTELMRRVGLEP